MNKSVEKPAINKKRVGRIKKGLIMIVLTLIMVPTIVCVCLCVKMNKMSHDIAILQDYIGVSSQAILSAETHNYGQNVVMSSLDNNNLITDNDISDSLYTADPYEGYIKVCLTFDDGPSANTDAILDILDSYGLKATFFVNAHDGYDEQYQRIVNEGHTLGMHSYSHSYSSVYKNLDSFAQDLYDLQEFLEDKTGVIPDIYRFPGGSSNNVCNVSMQDCIEYLNAKGIRYFDWNVSGQDAVPGGATATQIVNNIMSVINSGESDTYVVLLHDSADKTSTVEALPVIIEQIIDMENVVIVPIDQNVNEVQHVTLYDN